MLVDHEVEGEKAVDAGGPRRGGRIAAPLLPRLLTEEVVQAARHLNDSDRDLVRAVYQRGLPLKAIATIHKTSRGRVCHRLRMLVRRMRSPLFRLVVRERELWPSERRIIGDVVVLRGQSQREAAEELGVSLHRVRTELEHLKALAGVHRLDGDG